MLKKKFFNEIQIELIFYEKENHNWNFSVSKCDQKTKSEYKPYMLKNQPHLNNI